MKKYTVVLFTESNEPAVIPSLWLSNKEDGQWCYFPPSSLSDARFNRAVIDCLDPDNSWEEFKCRKLYESDDIVKARQKSRLAEDTSNLESEVEMPGQRRQRKRCKVTYESDSTDADNINVTHSCPPKPQKPKNGIVSTVPSSLPSLRQPPIRSKQHVSGTSVPYSAALPFQSAQLPLPINSVSPLAEQNLFQSKMASPCNVLPNGCSPAMLPLTSPVQLMQMPVAIDLQTPNLQSHVPINSHSQSDNLLTSAALHRGSPSILQTSLQLSSVLPSDRLMPPNLATLSTPTSAFRGSPSILQTSLQQSSVLQSEPVMPPNLATLSTPTSALRGSPSILQMSLQQSSVFQSEPVMVPHMATLSTPISAMRTSVPVTDFERCLLKNVIELKNMITDVQKTQMLLTNKVDHLMRSTGATSGTIELPDEIQFPLKSVPELERFEELMRDSQFKPVVVRSISTIGGGSVKEATKRLLRHVMSDNCAKHMNWKGKNNKRAFAELELKNIICRAVRMNPLTAKGSDNAIENEIKEWLKFASDRLKKKRERTLAKSVTRPRL